MTVESAYQILYISVLLALGVLIAIMLVRSVITKGVMERILCVNMLSTMVICSIAVLSRMLEEAYLVDVALIYAMISFVTVLMLSLTHIPPGEKRHRFMAGHLKELRKGYRPEKQLKSNGEGSGNSLPDTGSGGASAPGPKGRDGSKHRKHRKRRR